VKTESNQVSSFVDDRLRSRRWLLRRGLILGLSAPAAVTLLAACGSDDEDSTATTATEPTATSGAGEVTATTADEATPTMAAEATPTEAVAEPTATEAMTEPTATEEAAEATPTEAAAADRYYGREIEPPANTGGTLVRGTSQALDNLLAYPWYINAFEFLVEQHPDTGEPMPVLAEGWEAADDGLSWTFYLRPDVRFNDGEPFTTEDVIFSIGLYNNAIGFGTPPVDEATITEVDELTLDFEFAATAVAVQASLTSYPMWARHALPDLDGETSTEDDVYSHPANIGTDFSGLVTTAPFVITGYVAGESLTMTRNDLYWDGTPILDEIVWRAFGTQDVVPAQLESGEIDFYGGPVDLLNPALIDSLGADIEVVEFPGSRFLACMWNQNPEITALFQDVRVRQAMLYALDRQAIIDTVLFGRGDVPSTTLILPWAYFPEEVPERYPYDPEMAAALLDEAGWLLGSDGMREKDGETFSFEGLFISGDSTHETTIAILQEYWRAIGIDLQPRGDTLAVLSDRIAVNKDAPFGLWNVGAAIVDHRLLAGCGANRVNYCNTELDAIMAEAAVELDVERRRQLTTDVVNFVMEEAVYGWLFIRSGVAALGPRVHNVFPNTFDIGFNMETWWVDA
jgi:peptide/nickel transport system substrate-binding protein